ncbi:MAG: ATP-binding cassette domain-containing protein, partial [Moritella sp.]|uniref:ABC transporter ATP-binding protein n=1 Tax=Moritella sp. TaxID=78556 RepID=UPI001D2D343E
MIKVDAISKHFGGVRAIDNVSFEIKKGSITGLIGPNGAGKTTMFNTIAGLHKPTHGRILLDGQDINGLEPHQLFARGLLRTFQLAHEFSTMTVIENLMMVPPNQLGESLANTWFRRGAIRQQERVIRQKAEEVIEFLKMDHVAYELA